MPDASGVAQSATTSPAPAASWVDRLIQLVEWLPGPSWLAYVVGLAPTLALLLVMDGLSGASLQGAVPIRLVWSLALVGALWLIHHLDGVARTAFEAFRPSLDLSADAATRIVTELTAIPARPALLLLALAGLRTAEGLAFQPGSEDAAGLTGVALAFRWVFETLLTGLIFVLAYHTVRQLRLVSQLHDAAIHIRLLRPAPLYAFSRLTSQTAIGFILLSLPFFVTNLPSATTPVDFALTLGFAGGLVALAVLAFLLPLLGMHRRMAIEKQRLQAEAGTRIETLIAELHASVDGGELAGADVQNKTLASLLAERELVHRLSTWPWQSGTIGAVASAVVLPIALWLVTRLFGRVV